MDMNQGDTSRFRVLFGGVVKLSLPPPLPTPLNPLR